jgi:hypothetical protein
LSVRSIISPHLRKKCRDLGINECRWTGSGTMNTNTGETIIYSGRPDNHRVAMAMKKEASKSLYEQAPISDRIIIVKFWSKYAKTTIIQVYAQKTMKTKRYSRSSFRKP